MDHFPAILHFMTFLLVMGCAIPSSFSTNITNFGCISGERNALLKLKASFEDPFNRLSSWHTSTVCCTWKGVVCVSDTSHGIGLHLRNTHWDEYCWYGITPQIAAVQGLDCNYNLTSSHLGSSLLELKYLSYRDLSGNHFQLSPITAFLGSMKQLQHLNLSNANFSGVVPHNLGNLSSLLVLDLNNKYGTLMADDLMWASNFSSIEHLDISGVDLSQAKRLSELLFHMLPSVLVLRLSGTRLNNTHVPHFYVNSSLHTNIRHLDLSYNSFLGEFPCFLHNMTSLKVLDLSENDYNSSNHHALIRLRNLVHLDLSGNSLHHKTDWISNFLVDKCHLKSLSLTHNNFYGELSEILFRKLSMGYCWTHKLETLNLGNNAFAGPIPTSIEKLRALRYLFLYNNYLSGALPISLGQISNLDKIDISNHSFNGTVVFELHFAKLSKLEEFGADSINLSVAFDWVPPFQQKVLSLQSCTFGGGQFPQWLQTQKGLEQLSLSNCSITGSLPELIDYLNLIIIDMSHNMISGSIPKLPPHLEGLYLSHNNIEGPIPVFGSNLLMLSLSDNMMDGFIPDSLCQLRVLAYLDLSRNHFSGNIPNCWTNLQNIQVLRLSANNLSGVIPNSLGECRYLADLHLNNNSLTGQLPHALKNCAKLMFLDVEDNQLTGELPDSIGSVGWESFPSLRVLILRNNEFHGEIPSTICQLDRLQVLDLANNKLVGNIPHCFGNFSGMSGRGNVYFFLVITLYWNDVTLNQVLKGKKQDYTKISRFVVNLDLSNNSLVGEIPPQLTNLSALVGLNLSHNHLGGKIPDKIGDMKKLESLDFSSNKLCGTIPESLSRLSFLASLNLSHNNLSGRIPTGS